jgi:hypothetical protein
LDTFKSVPAGALVFAAFGGLCGWLLSAGIEKLPASLAIFIGMAIAVALTGFNDPQLGVQQTGPPCSQLPGGCFHLPTPTTDTTGSGGALGLYLRKLR